MKESEIKDTNSIYANLCDETNGYAELVGDCVSFCPKGYFYLPLLTRCEKCSDSVCTREIQPVETSVTRKALSDENRKKGFDLVLESRSSEPIYKVTAGNNETGKNFYYNL